MVFFLEKYFFETLVLWLMEEILIFLEIFQEKSKSSFGFFLLIKFKMTFRNF